MRQRQGGLSVGRRGAQQAEGEAAGRWEQRAKTIERPGRGKAPSLPPPPHQCRARCVPRQHLLSEVPPPQESHILPDLYYRVLLLTILILGLS